MIALFCKALLAVLLAGALAGCAAGLLFGGTVAGVGVVHDRRTAGTIIEDQTIEFKAYHALSGSPGLRETAHVSVTSYNNAVLLSGETPTPELRDQAAAIVGGVDKVRHVYNELAVAPTSSLASRTSDTLLTGKVKTTLFQIRDQPEFDPTRVKVVTERGIVYLMGILRPEEAEAVVATVRQVGGVQKVVSLFEYI